MYLGNRRCGGMKETVSESCPVASFDITGAEIPVSFINGLQNESFLHIFPKIRVENGGKYKTVHIF
jgi:hypothetical protein